MARSSILTKLPIDDFFRVIGVNSLHGNGVSFTAADRTPDLCTDVLLQSAGQSRADSMGRDDIAEAILSAEGDIEAWLGYHLLPTWEVDERQPLARPNRPENWLLSPQDVRGLSRSVTTRWAHFIRGGQRATTLIDADATITYEDRDNDGYDETATVTATTTVTDPNEVHVYYPASDPYLDAADPAWEITPTKIAIAAGTVTVTFLRERAVIPELLEGYAVTGVDGTVDTNFLATVDLYRVWTDPQAPAALLWEPTGGACETGDDVSANAYSTQTAALISRGEPRLGMVGVIPATWDATNSRFLNASLAVCRAPDAVRLWYLSGYRDMGRTLSERQMDPRLARAVAWMAAARLRRQLCSCSADWFERYSRDLSYIEGADQLTYHRISARHLDNPFGTRLGEVMAWDMVSRSPFQPVVRELAFA